MPECQVSHASSWIWFFWGMISAEILLDSINPNGDRLTSWILKYPRMIHSEFMTHRVASRNAASSRAIPIEKMIKAVEDNPAEFEYYGANQKGMQARGEISPEAKARARELWLQGAKDAIALARELAKTGLHKQNCNRVLEPYAHMVVLATINDYHNFFKQRAHPDAQPEFMVLAYRMLDKFLKSDPVRRNWGDWHVPFGDRIPEGFEFPTDHLRIATARSARLSYATFDGDINPAKDFELHDDLLNNHHWSPFEHCAKAEEPLTVHPDGLCEWIDQGNFHGWTQYRKTFPQENVYLSRDQLRELLDQRPEWVTL